MRDESNHPIDDPSRQGESRCHQPFVQLQVAIAGLWGARLVIEKLPTPGSIPELVMRRCVLGRNA